ncbi:MAG: hypothetical protein CM15mP111_0920 [Hyphomicrobiales bacterium]|nr:MAG: hypothetical protein CM15mP111_0920 [Hyphomicrobiales bacterium]
MASLLHHFHYSDSAIDIAWRFGFSLNWLLQDTNGGSSAMNMLGHASRAIKTGDANNILILQEMRLDFQDMQKSLILQ